MKDFGVIVTCHKGDYLLAKGCCASIRYFMGDVPLCLLIDGDFPLDGLLETYDAVAITRDKVKSPFLKNNSFGFGITKMVAFWESPFEYFLLIDADTCIWGDMREHIVDYEKYDVIVDKPCYSYSIEEINKYFFVIEQMRIHFPKFKCLDRPFVCTGVIFGKRGIFDIKEYENMLNFVNMHPRVFFIGEQGFLNYMLFNAADEQKIKLGSRDIQYLVDNFEIGETKKKFKIQNGKPAIDEYYAKNCCEGLCEESLINRKRDVTESTSNSVVIHWGGGIKPIYSNYQVTYIEPMTYFRKKFLKDSTNKSSYEIDQIILKEDKLKDRGRRWRKRLKKFLSILIGKKLTSKLGDFHEKLILNR